MFQKAFRGYAAVAVAGLVALSSLAQAASLSIVNWNVGNLPNSAADQANMATVFNHMTSVAGRSFDVLAMSETDTASAVDTLSVARSVFSDPSYMSVVSAPDGGSDRTGFIYNGSTLSLLSSAELSTGLTHRIMRAHFQPVGGTSGTDFYVYSVHLKSGNTNADRTLRVLEAQQLRADADTLGSANVLFVGDFNWTSADELGVDPIVSAYDVFAASGEGRAFDPLNQVGAWRGNASYLSLHTNDPRGAMDDRFDMQLTSDELFDGVGMEFETYQVIGNNGTHVLNDNILTGSGAPMDVLNALYGFSDHLPVLATYSYTIPEPGGLCMLAVVSVIHRRRRR